MTEPFIIVLISIIVIVFISINIYYLMKDRKKTEPHYDGTVDIWTTDEDVKVFTLNLNSEPEDLEDNQIIIFKVNRN